MLCVEFDTSDVRMTEPGGRPLRKDADSDGEALLDDTAVVSKSILGLEDVGPGSSEEEGGSVRLVTTGKIEGMTVVGADEGSRGDATDDKEGVGSTVGRREEASCLCTKDLQDHSVSSLGASSVLAGRLDESPESLRTLDRWQTIIVPNGLRCIQRGEMEWWLIRGKGKYK